MNPSPAIMVDLFATTLTAAHLAPLADRVIDGRDLLPLSTSAAASPHPAILGQLGPNVLTFPEASGRLHVLPG